MRPFFFILASICLPFFVHAQSAPAQLDTEYAKVHLISDSETVVPGQTFYVAFDFVLEPHWHVYWQNPGASGLALDLEWDLPEGWSAGEILWPSPEQILLGGLVNYGYEDQVTFLVPITVASDADLSPDQRLEVDAFWLICKELCLPGQGRFGIEVDVGDAAVPSGSSETFEKARASLPKDSAPWAVSGSVDGQTLVLRLEGDAEEPLPAELYFYAAAEGVVDPNADQVFSFVGETSGELRMPLTEVYLSDPSETIAGVLQSGSENWSVSLSLSSDVATTPSNQELTIASRGAGFEAFFLELGLPGWLVLAYLGGLILNVMPCVLPVLSLKVFSLLKQSGQTKSQALLHGVAYTVGVVVSFLALAGLLFALRALGERVGWGFQLQSPGFVVVLTLVFFLFALNLMGVFELGSSLVGADAKVAKRRGLSGSFGMGVLAAVVGAPCVGPLLASVGGIAVQAPPVTGLLIFATMGFGLASPFLLLAIFPKLVAYLPKPGAWMESVKQFMGFLLLAAVVFLAMVAGASGGADAIMGLLIAILLSGFAAWIYGRWAAPVRPKRSRRIATVLGLLFLGLGLVLGVQRVQSAYLDFVSGSSEAADGSWGEWSTERVETELAAGNPVFIDFTATWCLICQVNKKVALRTDETKSLFAEAGVVTLEADWTRYDPEITDALESFGRNGVPLYVLYGADGTVQVLPQSLTNGILRDAVKKMEQ